ncbi:hypothetical protein ACFOGI_15645 [Virgibacillus xinjiangensis]|uniref:Uncharacterized protein n=1 Tax=Virgibacillus xinjiangensis TaxID=393090 RepID=A0ABV7CZE7_9BACI
MRYWKLIALPVIIILVTGGYYVQNAMAGNDYPDFSFNKVDGAEEAVEDVTLLANYHEGRYGDAVKISGDGSVYYQDLSYIDRLAGNLHKDPAIASLQKEYRGFMRGKHANASYFSQYKDVLAFASVEESDSRYSVVVDTLHTESEESSSFRVNLPDSEEYRMMYTESVELTDGVLTIFARSFRAGNDELHYYRVDMDSGKLVGSGQLHDDTGSPGEGSWTETRSLSQNRQGIAAAEYSVFQVNEWEEVPGPDGNTQPQSAVSELVLFHHATGDKEVFDVPEDLRGSLHTAVLDGSTLYLSRPSQAGTEIMAFELTDRNMEKSKKVVQLPLASADSGESVADLAVNDGKMYIAGNGVSDPRLFIVELTSGEVLYEGVIDAGQHQGELMVHELLIP